MLTTLEVRDLAVIRAATLEFGPGFTVLTGETGAGKSLLVDALGLVLGARGSSGLVRAGADHASVTAEITVSDREPGYAALAGRGLPLESGLVLLHRQMSADGRSRAWINGVSVPLAALRELAEGIAEIHGQFEHLALARPRYQRGILDAFAKTPELAAQVADAADGVRAATIALDAARATLVGREARLEFLRFQTGELDALGPRRGEYTDLMSEYERLRHGERFREALQLALSALDEGERPALATLAAARQALSRLPRTADIGGTAELLVQAEALAAETVSHLRRMAGEESDPEQLDRINARIAGYQALARKHDVEPDALAERRENLAQEAEELAAGEDRLERLERDRQQYLEEYRRLARDLSKRRRAAAPRFARAITRALRELGMPQADFEVVLEPEAGTESPPGGAERVLFRVTTNAGQAAGPVAQVASGGELSRLCLAVETQTSGAAGVPVQVFDEVDAGVSGRVAELVGRRLKALASQRQVLCVTHLPQVAALADHHHAVSKADENGVTVTRVETLDAERRIEAIAQMLGGVEVGDSARAHARELLLRAAGE